MTPEEIQLTDRTCAVCGLPELSRRDPLCGEGLNEELLVHLRCFGSPAGQAWRAAKRAAEPAYDRYTRLMSPREPVTCPHCGATLELWPKGIGMGASPWTATCTGCHRTSPRSISPYAEKEAYHAISAIRNDFVRWRNPGQILSRLREVARKHDHLVGAGRCACGGRFSLASPVRCLGCDGILIQSCFHTAGEPLSEKKRKELEELTRRHDAAPPENWEDIDGWERHYATISKALTSYRADDLGSFEDDRLPILIVDLLRSGVRDLWLPGCGVSHLPKLLAEFGFAVHATDASPTAVRYQTSRANDARRLIKELEAVGMERPPLAGPFTAAVHDFRTTYLASAFDLVINQRAFQAFPRPSMEKIAASHFAALRPGGRAMFDTTNVQGAGRDELEDALVSAGFYAPLFEANRRLRRELAATGIPHVIVLGHPIIPRIGEYAEEGKRKADTAVLRRIFAEHQSRMRTEYQQEQRRVGPDAKVAIVIYSTGCTQRV